MIHIADTERADTKSLLEKEWLETNGCGGYSSSTILHCHSRKYHGLLVANLDIPGGRFVLLSKCEDSIRFRNKEFFLSMHKYPMVFYPGGHHLTEFTLDLYPRFTYRIDEILIEKDLMIVHEENTLLLRYTVKEAPSPVMLTVKPLMAYRGIHDLAAENFFLRDETRDIPNGFAISPYDGMPRIYMQTNRRCQFIHSLEWYRNFEYSEEQNRGFSYQEDLFMPGVFEYDIPPGGDITFRVSLHDDGRRIDDLWETEQERRQKIGETTVAQEQNDSNVARQLRHAARDFIIRNRSKNLSIVAGYHWFYEWGRDALISLPGLTLYTNMIDTGIEILKNMGSMRKDGLIPNNIAEKDERGSFNSVDASLWYFWCIQQLLKVTGDLGLIKKYFLPVMIDIITHYFFGTSEYISVLDNGLLRVGNASTQLTWMDATVQGVPVTPRQGCPVEINALWYNALCFTEQMVRECGGEIPFDATGTTDKLRSSFDDLFWVPVRQCLADTWIPEVNAQDESIRPNQIFAVSLPFSIMEDREKAASIMDMVSQHLFTPYGLRTLSPADPRYRGKYRGTPDERDGAYHQGTVWPWLSGHYGEALLKTGNNKNRATDHIGAILTALGNHIYNAGLGSISEIFDGDPPHKPHGCIAQAWSVAEIIRLRALIED